MTDQAQTTPKEAKGGVFSNADIPLIKTALLAYAQTLDSDHPDMSKLNDCGSRINNSVVHIEQNWEQLQRQNPN